MRNASPLIGTVDAAAVSAAAEQLQQLQNQNARSQARNIHMYSWYMYVVVCVCEYKHNNKENNNHATFLYFSTCESSRRRRRRWLRRQLRHASFRCVKRPHFKNMLSCKHTICHSSALSLSLPLTLSCTALHCFAAFALVRLLKFYQSLSFWLCPALPSLCTAFKVSLSLSLSLFDFVLLAYRFLAALTLHCFAASVHSCSPSSSIGRSL